MSKQTAVKGKRSKTKVHEPSSTPAPVVTRDKRPLLSNSFDPRLLRDDALDFSMGSYKTLRESALKPTHTPNNCSVARIHNLMTQLGNRSTLQSPSLESMATGTSYMSLPDPEPLVLPYNDSIGSQTEATCLRTIDESLLRTAYQTSQELDTVLANSRALLSQLASAIDAAPTADEDDESSDAVSTFMITVDSQSTASSESDCWPTPLKQFPLSRAHGDTPRATCVSPRSLPWQPLPSLAHFEDVMMSL